MEKIVRCPRCKGKGKVYDVALGVFTLGISTFFEAIDEDVRDDCPRCGGVGFLKLS